MKLLLTPVPSQVGASDRRARTPPVDVRAVDRNPAWRVQARDEVLLDTCAVQVGAPDRPGPFVCPVDEGVRG